MPPNYTITITLLSTQKAESMTLRIIYFQLGSPRIFLKTGKKIPSYLWKVYCYRLCHANFKINCVLFLKYPVSIGAPVLQMRKPRLRGVEDSRSLLDLIDYEICTFVGLSYCSAPCLA